MSVIDLSKASGIPVKMCTVKRFWRAVKRDFNTSVNKSVRNDARVRLRFDYRLNRITYSVPTHSVCLRFQKSSDFLPPSSIVVTNCWLASEMDELTFIVDLFDSIQHLNCKNLIVVSERTVSKRFVQRFELKRAVGQLFIIADDDCKNVISEGRTNGELPNLELVKYFRGNA